MAETVRFELTDGCPSAVFKTAGLNHSPKSPGGKARILAGRRDGLLQHALGFDEGDHLGKARQGFEVGHHKRLEHPLAVGAHAGGVGVHHIQIGAHVGGQVGLVDDEQVALGDARAALARDFLAGGDVDDVDGEVREFGAECGGQIVAAAFHEDDVGVGVLAQHAVDGFEVDGAVFADGGVGAAAGLHAQDALRWQGATHREQALVFLGVDVVGDGDQIVVVAHGLAEHLQQGGLAGAHGAADADAQGGQIFSAIGDVVQCVGHGVVHYQINSC